MHTQGSESLSFARHHPTEITPQHDLSLGDGENNVQQDYINYQRAQKKVLIGKIATFALQHSKFWVALTFNNKSLTFAIKT